VTGTDTEAIAAHARQMRRDIVQMVADAGSGHPGGSLSAAEIVSTLYFGGWRAPFTFLDFIPGPIWLFIKIAVMVFIYIWVRWTIFRYRYNQLMSTGWKVLLPLSIANLVVTAVVVTLVK